MAKQKQNEDFLPTPPIGYRVQWLEQGLKNRKCADVVAINEHLPGCVTLSVNLGRQLKEIEVVHWENHPNAIVGSAGVKRCGTWAYMPDTVIPESHYATHVMSLEMQADNVKRQKEFIAEQKRNAEEAASRPIDPIAIEVARIQANAIVNG